jgi:hypothetical protein
MMPLKSCEHYDEYESYHTSFFIITLNEDQFFFLVQGLFHSYETYNVLTYLAIVKSWCDLCVNA